MSTLSFWYVFDCPHVTASFPVVLGNFGCDVICRIAWTGLGTRLRSDCSLWRKFNSMRILQTHVLAIFYNARGTYEGVINHFWPFTLIRYVCVSVLINFQERFEIYALLMKTLSVLVWTEGLCASKCTRFQKKTHESVVFGLKSESFFSHAMSRSGNKDTNAETY